MDGAELLVSLFCKLALHPDHSFEAGVKEGYPKLEQDGKFTEELLVEHIEDFLGIVVFLLRLQECPVSTWKARILVDRHLGKFRRVFAWLGDELVEPAPCGIVV